jgi:hypothetical protein
MKKYAQVVYWPIMAVLAVFLYYFIETNGFRSPVVHGQTSSSLSKKTLLLQAAREVPLAGQTVLDVPTQIGGGTVATLFPQNRRLLAGQSVLSPVVNVSGSSRLIIRMEAAQDNADPIGYIIRFGPMPNNMLTFFNDDQAGILDPGIGVDVDLPVRGPMVQVELLNLGSDTLMLGSGAALYAP